MPFDIMQWQNDVRQHVTQFAKDPKGALARAGTTSVYGFLLGSTMLPVVAAYAVDPKTAIMTLLGIVGGIGGNLVANLAQQKYDRANVIAIAAAEIDDPESAAAYEAIAQAISVIPLADQALRQAEQVVILEQLHEELRQHGKTGLFAGANISVQQSDGVNFGIGTTIGQTGDIMLGDTIAGDKYISGRDTNITIHHHPRNVAPRSASSKAKRAHRNAMTHSAGDASGIGNEREHLQELLERKKHRLYALELRVARADTDTSPEEQTEIDNLKTEIKRLRTLLATPSS